MSGGKGVSLYEGSGGRSSRPAMGVGLPDTGIGEEIDSIKVDDRIMCQARAGVLTSLRPMHNTTRDK